MRRIVSSVVTLLSLLATSVALARAGTAPVPEVQVALDPGVSEGSDTVHGWWDPFVVVEHFRHDPIPAPNTVVAGAALDRLTWEDSAPAWPGDRRGSLSALYDASLPAGLFGFTLPHAFDQDDAFTAAATFVIDPDEFEVDPNGFFQLSWGLWNTETTGLDRTGDLSSFATDTFELLEFDWFPNVSPLFGGPFLSPTIFGVQRPDVDPPDAFANAAFAFNLQVSLPLGVPLLAVIEHDRALDVVVASVHRIVRPRRTVPVPGAVTVIALDELAEREYRLDAVGLTLWNDGFGGPTPAVRARIDYHALVVRRGRVASVDGMLLPRPHAR